MGLGDLKVYVVYRVLYGEDFFLESLGSVASADKTFIFWTDTPRGDPRSVVYRGETIRLEYPFDNVWDVFDELDLARVELVYDRGETDINQFTRLVNDRILPYHPKPDVVCLVEPDHVFSVGDFEMAVRELVSRELRVASTKPLEHWRTPLWRVPFREGRLCTMMWNMNGIDKIPETGRHANPPGPIPYLDVRTHNFGLCISEQNMYWKHLLALASSPLSGDSPPDPAWFERWKNWKPDDRDLDIPLGNGASMPYAEPFPRESLPSSIRDKYGYF